MAPRHKPRARVTRSQPDDLPLPKISWLSNAPWAATGYGNQTRVFAPRIKNLGYDLAISSFYGLQGWQINWQGIPVYPKGKAPYGQDVMSAHAQHFGADIIISLLDIWVLDGDQVHKDLSWYPWFPIDHEPITPDILTAVKKARKGIVISQFGKRMAEDVGLEVYYVPHGVETDVFRPLDRKQSREALEMPTDRFLVGMVAANKGVPSRKAFPQQIGAFATFHRKHRDTMLYLHTEKGADGHEKVDLVQLCEFHGLEIGKDVLFADPYQLVIGFPDPYMVLAYSAMDVHMLVSLGEGFGIPILEAQACGTPVIVGDWTSMSELCFAGWKVDKSESERWWSQFGSYMQNPHEGAIVDRLEQAYAAAGDHSLRVRAREGAMTLDADKVTAEHWKPVLDDITATLRAEGKIGLSDKARMARLTNIEPPKQVA